MSKPPKIAQCKCPIGSLLSDCPFSFDNWFHSTRDAFLILVDVDRVSPSVKKLTFDEQVKNLRQSNFFETSVLDLTNGDTFCPKYHGEDNG